MAWYTHTPEAGQQGPYADEEFAALASSGTIPADTLVWREGMAEWRSLGTGSELAATAGLPPGFPRDQTDEFHHLILTTPADYEVPKLAELVSRLLGVPRPDVIGQIKSGYGFLHHARELPIVEQLRDGLAAAGVATRILPAGTVVERPELAPVRKAVPTPAGLEVALTDGARVIPWSEFLQVGAGQVQAYELKLKSPTATEQRQHQQAEEAARQAGGMLGSALVGSGPTTKLTGKMRIEIFTDLLARSGTGSVRLLGNSFDYSWLGDQKEHNAVFNLKKLVTALDAALPESVLRNRGWRGLLRHDQLPAIMQEIKYDSREAFEQEERWLLQLAPG